MWTQLKRLMVLGAIALALVGTASPTWAQDETTAKPTATVEGPTKYEHYYDLDALLDAAKDADAEDGVKTGTVRSKAIVTYSDGTSETRYYNYSLTLNEKDEPLDADGNVVADPATVVTSEISQTPEGFMTSNLWIMIAAMLVFIMHLGFAMVESGLTRAKNTVNILFKNTMIPMIGIVMYAVCGWLIMYPGDNWKIPGVFAFGFGIGGGGVYSGDYAGVTPEYHNSYTVWTDFLFQGMFAATCATIVSGAVAGRIKLLPFLIFSVLFVGILYPITGSWKWGGGWLAGLGFLDFAGSTLVHAVGGAGALAGALILGPRIGKYAKDGTVQPIPGHSMPLATIGVFLLWFGWFGFNGGSELSANPGGVSYVLMTTTMAACGGGLACAGMSWIMGGKPDLSMALNGILAGLVGITAGPDIPSWIGALLICGAVPGVLCYFAVLFFDKLKIDDPVGAISVHGVCGIYGTLACAFSGLFEGNVSGQQFGIQLIGTAACFGAAFVFAFVVFTALKATMGLRVTEEEEIEGLDLGEHDMSAYPDFQRTYIKSYHAREI